MSSWIPTLANLLLLALLVSPSSQGAEFHITHVERRPSEIRILTTEGQLSLLPLLDNAVRVRFSATPSEEAPSLIINPVGTPAPYELSETEDAILVRTRRLLVKLDRTTGAIGFLDPAGRPLLSELPGSRRLEASSVRGEATWRVRLSFDAPTGEHLFGLGQFQDGHLDVRDLPRRLTQVNTQIAIPMVISSRGFGLLWHNYGLTDFNPADSMIPLAAEGESGASTSVDVTTTTGTQREERQEKSFRGTFEAPTTGRYALFLDVGQKMARRWYIEVDGRPVVDCHSIWLPPTTSQLIDLQAGTHSVRIITEKNDQPTLSLRAANATTDFRSPVADAIDYVVIAGQGDTITAAYRQLTGQAPLMPRWALGYIHCRERYKSQEELLSNAGTFRERQIPADVIVQDWMYWGRLGWNAMKFDEAAYPDPAAMIRTLHGQNLRFMLSVWSKVDPESELGREFVRRKFLIPDTTWVDFFNPQASAFYWQNVRTRLLPLGIDAWWQDATEPENDDLAGRTTHAGPGEKVRNLYPLQVNRTVYEGLLHDDPQHRPFILTRCAFLGQQRYASSVWTGDIESDWDSLRRQITAGLGYVVTGLPWWTTDTGGFFRPGNRQYTDPEYIERLLRWMQFSTFTPLLRVHGYQSDTEPWRYGGFAEGEIRRWLKLRYQLLPYLYSEAARISSEGTSLMRPLIMDFPDDPTALEQTAEYLFGPAFLVAPVLSPDTKHWPVYLPPNAGGWFDFWTGSHFSGKLKVSADAPIEKIPLFVRAGSIVPLGPELQYTAEKAADPLELRVYTGRDAHFTLYEDDGVSRAHEKGECSRIPMRWDEASRTLSVDARQGSFPDMLKVRTFRIVWIRPAPNAAGSGSSLAETDTIRYTGKAVQLRRP